MHTTVTMLPPYSSPPAFVRVPSYATEPRLHERRIAVSSDRRISRPQGSFVKETRGGAMKLRLSAQNDSCSIPVYGRNDYVTGVVDINQVDGIHNVELKMEGRLRLNEVAEGGSQTINLCLLTVTLWKTHDRQDTACPHSLTFGLEIPTTYEHDGRPHLLPPSFNAKLSGMPGFTADIDYSISIIVNKPSVVPSLVSRMGRRATVLGTSSTISTPFHYFPRSRPNTPLPASLKFDSHGSFLAEPSWCAHHLSIYSSTKGSEDLDAKLHLPAARIFSIALSIPFHLTFEGTSHTLTAFLPFGPATSLITRPQDSCTRLQLLRQISVDVGNRSRSKNGEKTVQNSSKTEMWKVQVIGDATFRHVSDGPSCSSFSGEVHISPDVTVTSFSAGGLCIRDYLVLSWSPPEARKAPFKPFRLMIPIRLTTDPWEKEISQQQHSIPRRSVKYE